SASDNPAAGCSAATDSSSDAVDSSRLADNAIGGRLFAAASSEVSCRPATISGSRSTSAHGGSVATPQGLASSKLGSSGTSSREAASSRDTAAGDPSSSVASAECRGNSGSAVSSSPPSGISGTGTGSGRAVTSEIPAPSATSTSASKASGSP